jgi:murein DD-endopeptidase MepM/ murein hydrolase activator NlpD
MMTSGTRCGDAPFIFPTNGLIGFIWDDSFRPGHRHAGIDIFAGTELGVTPIIAAYPGYLTRQSDWKSTVIIRVPDDPIQPGRQIWVYYTHMADPQGNSFISPEFPAGTTEVYVEAGSFLGYQGNYSGDVSAPVGLHLHVSVVKDDGFGRFKNELDINNTYDPSPYFGLPLNANINPDTIPVCQ